MRGSRLGWFFGVLAVAGAAACSKSAETTKPSAQPSASATPSAAPSVSARPTELAPSPKPACRALRVTGRALIDGLPITAGSLMDGEHWVDLEAGATIFLRHTTSSRELQLIGPARVLPCRAGAEQVLLARGQLSTAANLGVRPGAEVLIATPEGTVRYGDAALDVELGDKGLRVRVKQGEAFIEPQERGKPRFKNPVHGGGEARLQLRRAPSSALLAGCQAAARAARESAERVLTPANDADAGSLGERASTQMRDRAKARIACAVAASAVGATEGDAERQSLSAAIAHADELWQSVPRAISGQKN